jgi:hypothetical protein
MIDSQHRDKQSVRCRAQCTAKVNDPMTPNSWYMTQQQAVVHDNSASPSNSHQASLNKVISLLEKLLLTQEQNQRELGPERHKLIQPLVPVEFVRPQAIQLRHTV